MCKWGTDVLVRVKIPADLSHTGATYWREMGIDACIAPLVKALQAGGIDMRGSCCGHGKGPGNIHLQDGRQLVVYPDGDDHYLTKEYQDTQRAVVRR
jgi:hypothetical protein